MKVLLPRGQDTNLRNQRGAISSGAPSLWDRVLAVHAGSRGFDSQRRHMSERFSDPLDQDIRTQCALRWKKHEVVSEWRSVIAVLLNVSGGVRLIKLHCTCTCKNPTNITMRTHGAGCARPGFCTAKPLEERRYENWIKSSTTSTGRDLCPSRIFIRIYHVHTYMYVSLHENIQKHQRGA